MSRRGMVAAAHPLAAQAGARILGSGGNAFDAAVATAAALDVVEPYMSGLAGMGVATIYVAAERRVRCLDFIPNVPLQFDSDARGQDDLVCGPHGVGPPANLAGWLRLLDTYGTRSRADVFADAINLARDGFPVTQGNTHLIEGCIDKFTEFPCWSDSFLDRGRVPRAGWILCQPDLADTYGSIVSEGGDYLYNGSLGHALVKEIQDFGGALSMDDLSSVEARWIDPIQYRYRGLDVYTGPPPAEGFQMLLALGMLDCSEFESLRANDTVHLDRVIRAIRISARERLRLANAPHEAISDLLMPESIEHLCGMLDTNDATDGLTEQIGISASSGSLPDPHREHTTSFSIMDMEGNVICLTQSLGGAFGSGIVVQGYGVTTNNLLNWGDLDPRSPNHLYPGSPLSLPIAPSVSLLDGDPVLALGTPGSYGICQTQTQAIVQWADFGLDIQAAIEAPRMRVLDGAIVLVESRIEPRVIEELRAHGHDAKATDPWTMAVGGMQGVARDRATRTLEGGADPRRDGYAIGV